MVSGFKQASKQANTHRRVHNGVTLVLGSLRLTSINLCFHLPSFLPRCHLKLVCLMLLSSSREESCPLTRPITFSRYNLSSRFWQEGERGYRGRYGVNSSRFSVKWILGVHEHSHTSLLFSFLSSPSLQFQCLFESAAPSQSHPYCHVYL